ncbi:esterase-like activity of phytase family protein [uncultured Acinetobacter sp.]|uniref:esterase-like activity of phytase family protein n=1 Tax=uncultured Acinetobacter sp. TaxID=165433 RepID=UPI00258619C0|nr:esterase-like activity of phytase family protein [uncultured Acinetobacter sp.]
MHAYSRQLSRLCLICSLSFLFISCKNSNSQSSTSISPSTANSISGLRLIGDYNIAAQTQFNGVEFGGISGIDRDSEGHYWAISDDRGEVANPRAYVLDIALDANQISSITINKMIYLHDENNQLHPIGRKTIDPESIRMAQNGHVYISSEGNYSSNSTDLYQPFIREYSLDGSIIRQFDIPKAFYYQDNLTQGGRSNKLFEALTLTPKGELFAATEDALIQDGPMTSINNGSVIRFLKFDINTGQNTAQYAYDIPKIPVDSPPETFPPDNGVSEMLALSENEFLVIERAYADLVGNTIRIVKATIQPNTTDVRQISSLVNAQYQSISKQTLLELPIQYNSIKIENIEGISWGPTLANGHRTLILVSDNNFQNQKNTQFLAFEVLP